MSFLISARLLSLSFISITVAYRDTEAISSPKRLSWISV